MNPWIACTKLGVNDIHVFNQLYVHLFAIHGLLTHAHIDIVDHQYLQNLQIRLYHHLYECSICHRISFVELFYRKPIETKNHDFSPEIVMVNPHVYPFFMGKIHGNSCRFSRKKTSPSWICSMCCWQERLHLVMSRVWRTMSGLRTGGNTPKFIYLGKCGSILWFKP